MISIENKLNCCGCSACSNICPKNAVKMVPDSEGFLYPEIDIKNCIDCGLCEKICPVNINRPEGEYKKIRELYLVLHLTKILIFPIILQTMNTIWKNLWGLSIFKATPKKVIKKLKIN